MKKIILVIILFVIPIKIYAQENYDISTFLMKSTYKIFGEKSLGTCFILGKSMDGKSKQSYYVLITAAHVLNNMNGDFATIMLRKKVNEEYFSFEHKIRIRINGKPIWHKHPDADVIAMYVSLPKNIDIVLLPTSFLATDEYLEKYEIRPGDKLFALGFPGGLSSNKADFPILRTGTIASYPILPTKKYKTFLFDFEVFKGNSGGPVFMSEQNRFYNKATHIGIIRMILGIVVEEKQLSEQIKTLYHYKIEQHPLKLGVVIHASLIKELISFLPEKPE